MNWLQEGCLFDPSAKEFQSWESFIGEGLRHDKQKIVSFYSSFQIYWLKKIKELNKIEFSHTKTDFSIENCELTSENGEVYLETTLKIKSNISKEEVPTLGGGVYKPLGHKEALISRFKGVFDLGQKKEYLKIYGDFNKMLKFFLLVQSVYYPYAKSGGRLIQISGNERKWQELKRNFKLDEVLNKLDLKIAVS